jgi:hypothetical protein
MKDWLPEGHPAWFGIDAVKEMDLDAFYEGNSEDGSGNVPHDPERMVTLLLFADTRGIRSSRMIEAKCTQDVAFRIVAANQQPDCGLGGKTAHSGYFRIPGRARSPLAGVPEVAGRARFARRQIDRE